MVDIDANGVSRAVLLVLWLALSSAAQTVTVQPDQDTIPRVAAALEIIPLSFKNQTAYYLRHTFDAGSLLSPALPAAILMANPPKRYPREWRNGGAAYGGNFGDALACETAAKSGKYLAAALLHEDPRYYPDVSKRPLHRVFHALAFTVVDRSTDGKPRFAASNFAGALSGGFVGRAYLPDGYSDNAHAIQRSGGILGGYIATQLVGFATQNLVDEFKPELKALAKKLHIPFVR